MSGHATEIESGNLEQDGEETRERIDTSHALRDPPDKDGYSPHSPEW
jgi:hypothetical protein